MKSKSMILTSTVFLILLISAISVFSQTVNSVKVGHVYRGEVDFAPFTIKKDCEVNVEGAVCDYYDDEHTVFYFWILDSKTRKIVWHSDEARSGRRERREESIVRIGEKIRLNKGDYEIYYTSVSNRSYSINSFGDAIRHIFGIDRHRLDRRDLERLEVTVSGPADCFESVEHDEFIKRITDNAIVSIMRTDDREHISKGFSLKDDTKLHIYAVGEATRDNAYDYAFIYDLNNYRRVWEMNYRNSDYAGGAEKNVLSDDEIVLPKGNYMVHYITDDSHSYRKWNDFPPDDPQFWGVTIWVSDKEDMDNVVPLKKEEIPEPVVEIIRVRDDEFISQGITIKKPLDLRILCLGEESGSWDMCDYGWIIDADTRDVVWEMKRNFSEHAGGAEKNRMVNEIVHLNKGNYIVHYVTDGSHSYHDWNSGLPYEPERWGITIWPVNEKDRTYLEKFDEWDYKREGVLAEITRVRDDEYLSETFTLEKDTRVRIISIGEGDDEMYDYGWIENEDTRTIIWEMTYRKTRHAGGARKNREYNGTIMLPEGRYRVFYVTDGSHSYRDWNSSPPYDQELYGITVMIDK